LQVIPILADQIPEPGGIARRDSLDPLPVPLCDARHLTRIGASFERVPIPRSHMGHIDPQYPADLAGTPRRNLAQRAEEAPYVLVVFRHAAFIDASEERAAKDRRDPNIRPEHRLQEHYLKLNRVLHGMT